MKCVILFSLVALHLGTSQASSSKTQIRQKRAWIIDSFSIVEEHKGPFPYVLGTINVNRDYHVSFVLTGMGVDQDPKGILSINRNTGIVSVMGKVDYEQYKSLKLAFEARKPSDAMDTRLGVEITIIDINDNAPIFQKNIYEKTIEESMSQGSNLLTVLATDNDKPGSPNSTIQYRIASVTPITTNVEFFIEESGKISFKGCLDYEKAEKYIVLVEAKDNGEEVRLSSTCTVIFNIQDQNNHLPSFTGHTGSGRVNERDSGISVLRLHVTDLDSKNTMAWRAKYTLHGDEENHFSIRTDPGTNDGILTVEKPFDFEDTAVANVSVSVDNVEPFFSCKVTKIPLTGLWQIVTVDGKSGAGLLPVPQRMGVTVFVDDVNDPPVFTYSVKEAFVEENVGVGYLVEVFTAVDQDGRFANQFVYMKGDDPDNWVKVDPKTGNITTAKIIDRESPYVKNNTYTVTLYAVDDGQPPMTGTATLLIRVKDVNDNVPLLLENILDMCLSEGATTANVTAHDSDQAPFAGPYSFELLGDVKGKWHFDPHFGTTATLVKENTVHAGIHELQLKVYDTQGLFLLQNLSVAVCDCSASPNCRLRRTVGAQVGGRAAGVMFASLFLLLGVLTLAFLMSCPSKKSALLPVPIPSEHLIPSNIETPGTDCKVPKKLLQENTSQVQRPESARTSKNRPQIPMSQQIHSMDVMDSNIGKYKQSGFSWYHSLQRGNSAYKSMRIQGAGVSSRRSTLRRGYSFTEGCTVLMRREALSSLLSQRICVMQAPGSELSDYDPHLYAYEGDQAVDPQLDDISIPESDFSPDMLLDLGPKFYNLAAIISPSTTPSNGRASPC